MTPADMVKDIIQVVGSPAWSGAWTSIGIIVSTTLSIIAIRNSTKANQAQIAHRHHPRHRNRSKKTLNIRTNFWNLFFIDFFVMLQYLHVNSRFLSSIVSLRYPLIMTVQDIDGV